MSESSNRNWKMGKALIWANEIGAIAGPMRSGDTRESWLARAARRAGINYRHAKALFYGETKNPKLDIAESVLRAAKEAREAALKQAAQYETLAGNMNATDPDFFGDDVLALIDAARALRGLDRT